MFSRMTAPAFSTAFATSLVLAACSSGDNTALDDNGAAEAPVEEAAPADDTGDDAAGANGGDDAMEAAIAASFITFEDGDDIAITDINCYAADIPEWRAMMVTFNVSGDDGDGFYRAEIGGHLNPETESEFIVDVRVPERGDSEHGIGYDQYRANVNLWDDGSFFDVSEEGAQGSMTLARATHPVPGSVMPEGSDRGIEFEIMCP